MSEDPYLSLTPAERAELLDSVSRQRGLAPAILEKGNYSGGRPQGAVGHLSSYKQEPRRERRLVA